MAQAKFCYHDLKDVREELEREGISLPLSEETERLKESIKIGGKLVPNRVAIQPMEGCDGTENGTPGPLTLRRYDKFAKSGAGLIWAEAVAVVPEGRANPRQLMLTERNLDDFKRMTDNIKSTCSKVNGFEPVIIMQATHSGRYSKPEGRPAPMIAVHNPVLEKMNPVEDEHVVADGYLKALEEKYAKSAALAQKAGFDGVDIKACHRYLLDELLGAFERPGIYGGSFENRIRMLCNSIGAARAAVTGDFIVTSRLNIYDGMEFPNGFGVSPGDGDTPDMAEPAALISRLRDEYKMPLVNLTIGNPYFSPHLNRPYDAGPYEAPEHPLVGLSRMCSCIGKIKAACPDIAIMSSANSYLREFSIYQAAGMLREKNADIIEYGRLAMAYPGFASDMLVKGCLDKKKCCIACSKCSQLMRAGTVAGCVVRDSEKYLPVYREKVLESENDIAHEISGMHL